MDINCDAGESFGRWSLGDEEAIFPYVTSVNIACGFHAGDPWQIQQTIQRALRFGLRIGAHPSYPDLAGFGRRYMHLSNEEIEVMVLYQISALKGMVEAKGGMLTHVKPHGALYNESARNSSVAEAIARAVCQVSPDLILVGLANSVSLSVASSFNMPVWAEVFADRSYEATGELSPREFPGSVLHEEHLIRNQVRHFLRKKPIVSRTGELLSLQGDTICLHSDSPKAVASAQWIQDEVAKYSVE